MSIGSWKLADQQRWEISVVFETVTPLHVGGGDFRHHEDLVIKVNNESKPVDVNACIKGKNNWPVIPGSTIKGKLYQWFKTRNVVPDLLQKLFGTGHNRGNNDQGRGGKAQFHDARITQPIFGDQPWPYWCENTQTYIEASTAIDRHRRTALPQSLHYTEMVPPGVQFKFIITGVMNEQETALLVAALDSFVEEKNPPCIGANSANGNGRMKLHGYLQVKRMGATEIANWLAGFDPNNDAMAMESVDNLPQSEIAHLIKEGNALLQSNDAEEEIALTLKFDGPFLVNDPFAVKILSCDETTKTDHYPLLDEKKLPYLPVSSFRGALRSQAERIIRTLGGKCCDTTSPCKPIYEKEDLNQLCLACQIFGASGWKTVLNIHPFTLSDPEKMVLKKQEFVAIDRFHGGGKEGAKFNASHVESSVFKGRISFPPRMKINGLDWGKGLLALVLRDMQEGDVTIGFGANKGYGRLEDLVIKGHTQQTENIAVFRNKCLEFAHVWNCGTAKTPDPQDQKIPLNNVVQVDNSGFHNPYHFVPINKPDADRWPHKLALDAESYHSHGFYRNQAGDDKLYHGRIICRLETETPTFIGAGKEEGTEPAQINNYKLNNAIAIPATSLRGMISSLAEAASNSAMRVLDNGLLSYRKTAGNALRKIGMVVKSNDKYSIIPMTDTNSTISLNDAYGGTDMAEFIEKQQSWSPKYNIVFYLPENENNGHIVPQECFAEGMRPGILRILGKVGRTKELENKKNELFIPVSLDYIDVKTNQLDLEKFKQDKAAKEVPDEVLMRYIDLADQRSRTQKNDKDLKEDVACQSHKWLPFHLKGATREYDSEEMICKLPVKENDLIFYNEERGKITEIAFSSIWRGRVETDDGQEDSVYNFIPKALLPFNKNRSTISPAEFLFGFVEVNEKTGEQLSQDTLAFAGKVRVGAGIMPKYSSDDDVLMEALPLKALLSPKPPSPAFYFKPESGSGYIQKHELKSAVHRIKGRKYYLHALRNDQSVSKLTKNGNPSEEYGEFPWMTHDDTQNTQIKSTTRTIREGQAFYFDLDFNNLTEWEMGLLCYALRPTESFRHRIGMGKPIGLGSVKIDILALQTIDRYQRYATDDLNAQRFNQHRWVNTDYQKHLDEAGCQITPTSNPLIPDNLREIFTKTMNANIYRTLDLLGNPENIKNPVHYPQINNNSIEEENYQWFVANDQSPTPEILEDISKDTDHLPTLNRRKRSS